MRVRSSRSSSAPVLQVLITRAESHEILYHFNIGFPLLDDGTVLDVDTASTVGLNERTQEMVGRAKQVLGPEYGYTPEVVLHDTKTDDAGWVTASVVNSGFDGGRGLSLTVRYRKDELPFLWQWRNFRERGYVMGVEPGNAHMRGRAYNREQGTLQTLEVGERREYTLEVSAALGS